MSTSSSVGSRRRLACIDIDSDAGVSLQLLQFKSVLVEVVSSIMVTARRVAEWQEPVMPFVTHDRFEVCIRA